MKLKDKSKDQLRLDFKGIHVFALIFTALFLLHAPLLRLPYFWDEAGYYIPAAHDFFLHGWFVPQSIPSNAHPPLLAIYLALWWKLSAFKPAVTRIAMLLLAALGLTATFQLSRMLTNIRVALAVTICTAIYPIWFAQSSLAHADLPAAAFVLLGLLFYCRSLLGKEFVETSSGPILVSSDQARVLARLRRRNMFVATLFFALASLSKETSILFPVTLATYDLLDELRRKSASSQRSFMRPVLLLSSTLPLAVWFGYHYLRTGFFFGNPEFFTYNVTGTLRPLRVLLSLGLRIWQVVGYMNLWLLTLATLWAMRYPALQEPGGLERPRIALAVQYRFGAILIANLLAFSLIGGAVLARYLLPLYPLVVLIGISTLRRRVPEWHWAVGLITAGFVLALFANPFGYNPPEDNLSYRNYVILHKQAAVYLQQHDPHASVLTAWTATDELTKPFLGYVREPMNVVRIEDFSYEQLQLARLASVQYETALLFSTKQEPRASLLDRWPWWERVSRKYFGFHRDLPPLVAAQVLGGTIIWERRLGQQWVAIVGFNRVENASNVNGYSPRGMQNRLP